MGYKIRTQKEWEQLQYTQGMTDLQNFLVRLIVKFYNEQPYYAQEAFSGLYNELCVDWAIPVVEQDPDNNGGNCDQYLLEDY